MGGCIVGIRCCWYMGKDGDSLEVGWFVVGFWVGREDGCATALNKTRCVYGMQQSARCDGLVVVEHS